MGWSCPATVVLSSTSTIASTSASTRLRFRLPLVHRKACTTLLCMPTRPFLVAQASGDKSVIVFKTCRNCKKQFDPCENHPRACHFHPAHYGGETKRKFESVYKGGTMTTPEGGKISSYWHCCGGEDPFDPGCEASPHVSYDD